MNGYLCNCALCEFLRGYSGTHGGWCDPRRGYSEQEDDFIERVPDGFWVWPANHVDPPPLHSLERANYNYHGPYPFWPAEGGFSVRSEDT